MKSLAYLVFALSLSVGLYAQDLRQTDAAKAACGDPDVRFTTEWIKPTPAVVQAGKALVYVIATSDPINATCLGRRCGAMNKIGLDGAWLGAMQGNSFLTVSVSPGAHHLCANWESHAKMLSHLVALHGFLAEEGKTYYFGITSFISTELGGSDGFTLSALNEDEGRMLVSAYPYSQSTKK